MTVMVSATAVKLPKTLPRMTARFDEADDWITVKFKEAVYFELLSVTVDVPKSSSKTCKTHSV